MGNNMENGIITPLLLLLLILLIPIAAGQPGNTDPPNPYVGANLTASVAIVVVVFVAIIFFAGIFSIFLRRGSERGGGGGGGSIRRMVNAIAGMSRRGVDAEALAALPTFAYSEVKGLKIGMGALECAVCLSEFDDDETLRLLPKCDHVFHADCIDAWLASHTTCPVCRAVIAALEPGDEPSADATVDDAAAGVRNDAVVVQVEGSTADQLPTAQPLPARSRSVKAILFSKFPRSHSTGHSLLAPRAGGDCDRFTLKLPVDVRKQLVNRSLNRTAGEEFMRVRSSRRGYRTGDGSSRGKSIRRVDRAKSERWAFLGRTPSLRTVKEGPDGGEASSSAVPPKPFGSNVVTPLSCLGAKVNYDSSDETAPLH